MSQNTEAAISQTKSFVERNFGLFTNELIELAKIPGIAWEAFDAQDLERSVLDHQFESAGEQEIADQNSGRIAENQVRRRLAPAHIAAINHIIVN